MQVAITTLLLVSCASSAKLPPEAKKCVRTEENFTECLTEAVQETVASLTEANRDLGLVSLEPLRIPSLAIGAGTGAVLLTQDYKDVKLYNYSKARVRQFSVDFEKKTALLDVLFEEDLIWDAQYNVSGRILLLPVFGIGPCQITLVRCKMSETFELTETVKKGKKHFHVVSSQLTMDPERVFYRFENLFNGEKALGENINTVINDNWKEVFRDVQQGYEKAIAQINAGLLNNVFSKFSIADLFE